jgi:hypothetical protein
MRPEALVALLAEPDRMRVFAAVVLGATTLAEATEQTGLTHRTVAAAIRRLSDGGLLVSDNDRLVARLDLFKEVVKEYGRERAEEPLDPDRGRAAILRAFIVDGRLVSIPAPQGRRRVILEHLATAFEPGVRYPEREVDAILRSWHSDHAALRRYLVDEGLMAREGGFYWRIGGPVLT